jgi:hypothetical protein
LVGKESILVFMLDMDINLNLHISQESHKLSYNNVQTVNRLCLINDFRYVNKNKIILYLIVYKIEYEFENKRKCHLILVN